MVGLRELLGCNVIVFDAVILQCRAYIHASTARGHIGHIRGAKCRDNCPCFSTASSLLPAARAPVLLLFGRHPSVHDSLPPRSGAICQVARPFHHVDQEHLEVFQPASCLDVHSPRSSSESSVFASRWKSHGSFEIAKRGICLVLRFNRSWKVAPSSLNISGSVRFICIRQKLQDCLFYRVTVAKNFFI